MGKTKQTQHQLATPGSELTTQLGQRSIASMFSKSRISAAGGSGSGRAVPLMEFLDRKSEKRGILQGCVVDAGLTFAVRERLDTIRKNDPRSSKRSEGGDGTGQVSVDECSTSCLREEGTPTRSETKLHKSPPPVHHQMPENTECSKEFIDLSQDDQDDEDAADGEVYLHEERCSGIKRKRKLSQTEGAATELCPVCNDSFPREMLQAHVESELDELEKFEADSAAFQAPDSVRVEDGSASGDWGRFPEPSKPWEGGGGVNSRARPSLLVLGDEPRRRTRRIVGGDARLKRDRGPSPTFNHYADGGGWWDEGGVGVDAEGRGLGLRLGRVGVNEFWGECCRAGFFQTIIH